MSDTATHPLRKKQLSRAEIQRRKLREDIRRNLATPPDCKCDCHVGNAGAHPNKRCPCKEARRKYVS